MRNDSISSFKGVKIKLNFTLRDIEMEAEVQLFNLFSIIEIGLGIAAGPKRIYFSLLSISFHRPMHVIELVVQKYFNFLA